MLPHLFVEISMIYNQTAVPVHVALDVVKDDENLECFWNIEFMIYLTQRCNVYLNKVKVMPLNVKTSTTNN